MRLPQPSLLRSWLAPRVNPLGFRRRRRCRPPRNRPSRAPPPPLHALQPPQLNTTWAPLLTPEELQRGITYFGSGARLRRLARLLLDGQPVKAVVIGGSVTAMAGPECAGAGGAPCLCACGAALAAALLRRTHSNHVLACRACSPDGENYFSRFTQVLRAHFPARQAAGQPALARRGAYYSS